MLNFIKKSVLAGLLISLAGFTFLQCENKVVGAFLFSFGLIGVFILEANLYTGKVGYIYSKRSVFDLGKILLLNLVTAFGIGVICRLIYGTSSSFDSRMMRPISELFLDSVGCGILIYLAVEFWKSTKNVIPVIICVMAFILGGMEHSVADAFFLGFSELSLEGFLRIGVIVIGNGVGSLIVRLLQKGWKINDVSKSK
jgi:formate/nitrite transporter FocA (FNT family)